MVSSLTKLCMFDNPIEFMGYEFLIALSSDSLCVIDIEYTRIVERIIKGNDTNCLVLLADSEDSFLEAISIFKRVILKGENPIKKFGLDS